MGWIIPALKAAVIGIVPDVVRTLWDRIKGRNAKDPDDPTGTAPATEPTGRHRHAGPATTSPAALLLLSAAWLVLWAVLPGCSTLMPAYKAADLPSLVDLCNQAAPCTPCPDPAPPPVSPGAPGEPSLPPVDPGNPGPPDADAGGGQDLPDGIDLATVTWLDPSPAGFPVVATLEDVRVRLPQTIMWRWSVPAHLFPPPDRNEVIGNIWVIAKIDGRWYGSTWEHLRARTQEKTLEARDPKKGKPDDPLFIQAKRSPVSGYTPQRGDRIGIMATSFVRGAVRRPLGRSPVRWVVWP